MDILLPVDDAKKNQAPSFPKTPRPDDHADYWRSPGAPTQNPQQKLLFTVKPGGIAGYLGLFHLFLDISCNSNWHLASLCNTASYVDIKAKTDTYVGFLPLPALERILEKRPIVLLTLAKRLISMLSPLSTIIASSLC